MPERLSDTGCFADLATLEPGPDLIPYEVNSALWTDGAFKPRYMVVPPEKQISVRQDGSWQFPDGSILIKTFGFEVEAGNEASRRLIETRFMTRHEGRWYYATYAWNEDGTDGQLLDGALTIELTLRRAGKPFMLEYTFPDHDACVTCHGAAINDVLGPKTAQLNRKRDYDGVVANQLRAMAEIDLFALDASEAFDPARLPRMATSI